MSNSKFRQSVREVIMEQVLKYMNVNSGQNLSMNELSPKTYGSYIKKADTDANKQADIYVSTTDPDKHDTSARKMKNRAKGIGNAVSGINKKYSTKSESMKEFDTKDMPAGAAWKGKSKDWSAKNTTGVANSWYGDDENRNRSSAEKFAKDTKTSMPKNEKIQSPMQKALKPKPQGTAKWVNKNTQAAPITPPKKNYGRSASSMGRYTKDGRYVDN